MADPYWQRILPCLSCPSIQLHSNQGRRQQMRAGGQARVVASRQPRLSLAQHAPPFLLWIQIRYI
jgi:hypothetical protein